ncbi:MAG: SdiA-regulated domain-containing protein, partial [bacterium]
MRIGRSLVLAVGLLPSVTACRRTQEVKAAELRNVERSRSEELARRMAQADANPTKSEPIAMWIMPPGLNEISGLALTTRGTVLTHDDNVGRVSEIDPKTGVLLKSFSLLGNPKGDFEAITIAGNDIYLMTSDAKLFRFREGADGTQVPYSIYDTGLGKQCEFESLAYEADSSRLVMVCKRFLDKQEPHALVIYRLPLPLNRSTISTVRIPIQEVADTNHWKNFRASDINIDPFTKNYVIIASREKGLIEVTPDGDVVRSEPLPGD